MDTLDHIFGAMGNWSTCVIPGEGQRLICGGESFEEMEPLDPGTFREAVSGVRSQKNKPAGGIAGATVSAHRVARGLFGRLVLGRKPGAITPTKRCAVNQRLASGA